MVPRSIVYVFECIKEVLVSDTTSTWRQLYREFPSYLDDHTNSGVKPENEEVQLEFLNSLNQYSSSKT